MSLSDACDASSFSIALSFFDGSLGGGYLVAAADAVGVDGWLTDAGGVGMGLAMGGSGGRFNRAIGGRSGSAGR